MAEKGLSGNDERELPRLADCAGGKLPTAERRPAPHLRENAPRSCRAPCPALPHAYEQSAGTVAFYVVVIGAPHGLNEKLAARILPHRPAISLSHRPHVMLAYAVVQENMTTAMGYAEADQGLIRKSLSPGLAVHRVPRYARLRHAGRQPACLPREWHSRHK